MDRKTIILLAACFAAFLLLGRMVDKMFPPKPLPPGSTNNVATTQTPADPESAAGTNPPSVTGAAALPTTSLPAFPTNVAEVELTVTNDNARYIFTSRGGGIKEIELVHYPEKVSRKKGAQTNGVATLNARSPLPVLSLIGDATVQDDGIYELSEITDGVRAEKQLPNGLKIVKEFHISTNYLVHASVSYENTTSNALALPAHEYVVGTATPMDPDDDGSKVGMMWFNGSKSRDVNRSWFDNRTLGCFPGTPRQLFTDGSGNVVWAAAHNQYFAIVAMPEEPAGQVAAEMVNLPRPPADEAPTNRRRNAAPPRGYVTRISCPTAIVPQGGTLTREIHFFTGPKEYRTLARIAVRFENDVDRVMSFGWAGLFAKALLLAMNWLHHTFGLSYALAIIAITVIVKAVFWPVTAAQARMSKRMMAFQPQMKALQEKYKEDPLKLQKKMSEFWKEHKINPMSGCLPVLIQMPVFIGFFGMIQTAIELRGESFLWVADLSKPDTLFTIPGIGFPFNLLPLLMGATMLWQAHVAPASPSADPMQAKMMKYLPLIFLIFLYNFSAGLTLYWTVSNLLTILQTKLTKKIDVGLPTPAQSPALTPAAKKRK